MRILGIETSCDETAAAVLEIKGKTFKVLSHVIASQITLHAQYGGVYPSLAKREHIKNLPIVISKTLKEANSSISKSKFLISKLDAIAVTQGPGLSPCLWTGINSAEQKAQELNVPLIMANHMKGHLLVSLFSQGKNLVFPSKKLFPAIALIVSGGHTMLVLVSAVGKYKLLGETRDDAAGEAFDKTARILGLPYPGGPQLAKLSKLSLAKATLARLSFAIHLPRPMIHKQGYDMSFSGLKTAVLYDFQKRPAKEQQSKTYKQAMAKEIQQAVIDVLLAKTLQATQEYNVKSVILGGGVAANTELRKQLKKALDKTPLLVAPQKLCTDNAVMIALAGWVQLQQGYKKRPVEAKPNLSI
jgi:N6-L-threonylcarbamoyladenine synthase